MTAAWDVVVIGAGPAGSLASRAAAMAGARVLLVDKAVFPRGKVCGCCVNASALATLAAVGLGHVAEACGARPVREVVLAAGGRTARLRWPGGVSLSRERLDHALVEAATATGVTLRSGVAATLLPVGESHGDVRQVRVGDEVATASVVVVADGLQGRSAAEEPGLTPRAAAASRIGLGATLEVNCNAYADGVIHMAVARGGYVGVVRLEDGRLDVAAAVDPTWLAAQASSADAIATLLDEAGMPRVPSLRTARWRGTPRLTRRRAVAAWRVLVAGDAAGYVEPFTGEGMAWAMATGVAAGRLAGQGWSPGMAAQWRTMHRRLTARRRVVCRAITLSLRRPRLIGAAVRLLAWRPGLAGPIITGIHGAPTARPA